MSILLACFLGISQNAGTLPELNVYRTENLCITNSMVSVNKRLKLCGYECRSQGWARI